MKNLFILLLIFSTSLHAKGNKLHYVVEKGDQFGTVIFSLGYLRLWSGDANVNKFKNKIVNPRPVNKLEVGDKVYLDESEIVFKKNVIIRGKRIFFRKKIRRIPEWKALMAQEEKKTKKTAPNRLVLKRESETVVYDKSTKSSFDLYAGVGGFIARDVEEDEGGKTTTMTGLQPMLQLKGIYSHSSIGSLAMDLMAKKIITSEFSFPINTDFRFQYLPKWLGIGPVNIALSYSLLKHSYVGRVEEVDRAFELTADFVGVGIVVPQDVYWFEIYFEKALNSTTRSNAVSMNLPEGWRVDSELVYPLSKQLRLIPGINYYTTENSARKYKMSVMEFRTVFAWEF